MACYVGLSLVCILLTGSRRAFLGVFFVGFLVAMGTRHRWRWLALGLLLAPLGFCVLPENLRNRFLTIIDPSYGPHNATTSRNLRVQFFVMAMDLWAKNPLTGVGPAAFGAAANTEGHLQTHNLYAQAASELGTLGVMALFYMAFCFWRNAREANRLQRDHPWWEEGFPLSVARAAWLAVVLLLFMGLGGHNLFRYNWLWFGAFQIVALQLLRRRAAAEAAGELLPGEELPEEGRVRYGYAGSV
jgi:O-antigen ligase